MQQWTVEGADKDSGRERIITVEAEDSAQAEALAAERGMLVADVRTSSRTSAAKLLSSMVTERGSEGREFPWFRREVSAMIPVAVDIEPEPNEPAQSPSPAPRYLGLLVGRAILVLLAVFCELMAVAGIVITIWQRAASDRWYQQPVVLLSASAASCLTGLLMYACSTAFAALHNIARGTVHR